MTEQPNREYWNVMKGIGIVLVVMGHTCLSIYNYIYLFHLPLFFFISGYLYSEEKYGDKPFDNLINKIKTTWVKYVLVYWGYILLHNVFYSFHMIENKIVLEAAPFNLFDIVYQMVNAVFGMADEQMAGPLWFVPILVMGIVIMGFVIYFSRWISCKWGKLVGVDTTDNKTGKNEDKLVGCQIVKYGSQVIMVAILGSAGYWLESHGLRVPGNMQVAFVVMPFYYVGYLFRNTSIQWEKLLNLPCAIVAAVIVYIANLYYWLDLIFEIVYPTMHIVGFFGIYLCLYIGKVLVKIKDKSIAGNVERLIAFFGQASFTIMALHFVLLRIIDIIYSNYAPDGSMEAYLEIPVAYSSTLWPVYLIVGLGVPGLVHLVFSRAKLKI